MKYKYLRIMKISTYNFFGDELNEPILIEELIYKTNYDFSKPHRHNYNEIFFFTKGNGNHMIDFKNHLIKDNSIHFVSCHKVHRVDREIKTQGYVLMFKNELLTVKNESDLFFILECEKLNLDKKLFDEIIKLLKKIKVEIIKDTYFNNEIIITYLQLIFLKLKQHIQIKSPKLLQKSTDNFYQLFYKTLETNFLNERKTLFYAKTMHVTPIILNKNLKKSTGKTASILIKDRLLLESKRLLLDFSISIKEITIILNFTDQSHFSKFLLKETKLNPTKFRQTLKMYKKKE